MHDQTKAWLSQVEGQLPPEALPLAASLEALAQSMDGELAENGRVSGALAGAYRLTHQSLTAALKASQAPAADDDDDLFTPAGAR